MLPAKEHVGLWDSVGLAGGFLPDTEEDERLNK
jgi:hypothetical protein